MLVPAPGRFSTTNCCPRYSLSFEASSRALMSTPPPGVKPTSMRAGRFGYWARAAAPCTEHASARRNASTLMVSRAQVFAADLERRRNEAEKLAPAILHGEDFLAGRHRAEKPFGMPMPGRRQVGQFSALDAWPRADVYVGLSVVLVARRDSDADRARILRTAVIEVDQRRDIEMVRPAQDGARAQPAEPCELVQHVGRAGEPARELSQLAAELAELMGPSAGWVIGKIVG